MNGPGLVGWNELAMAWAAAMLRACWQGGLALGLGWAVARVWPRTSGTLRGWLLRLAYLKLLVSLAWSGSVALPLLPAPRGGSASPPRTASTEHPGVAIAPAGKVAIALT